MRKIISLVIAICTVLSLSIMTYADDLTSVMQISAAEKIVAQEISFSDAKIDFSTLSIENSENISINMVGMSAFVDFSRMEKGFDEFSVEYTTQNPDVAVAYDGRILAIGKGSTVVTMVSGTNQYKINVNVENEVPSELKSALNVLSRGNSMARISDERQAIIDKASDMVYVMWRPTQDLTGWRARASNRHEAGTLYNGIPYSQTSYRVDEVGFTEALTYSDFYSAYSREIGNEVIVMPKYGSDCSGFVSYAWNIPRQGTSIFYQYASIGGYENLQPGDAVVYRSGGKGHTFVVLLNYPTPSDGGEPYIACYEQTPPRAQLTFWKYSDLEEDGYKAISKFN